MALTKSITTDQGFEVPAAYAAIQDFEAQKCVSADGSKSFNVSVHLNVYKDSTKAICLYGVNDSVTVPYNDATVTLADLYTELKTLSDWADWLDA